MNYKSRKSNTPDKHRFIFLEIGLIIALSAALLAFNYRSERGPGFLDFDKKVDRTIEELPVITKIEVEKPAPPPPPTTIFNEVDDFKDVEIDFKIDVEDTPFTEAYEYIPEIPDEAPLVEDTPVLFADKNPEFPGGEIARLQFLMKNIRFPVSAREGNFSGTVYISFVVSKDGSIRDIEVLRGPGGGLNEEALRVALMMPRWEPGILDGKLVSVKYVMPVKFVLQ